MTTQPKQDKDLQSLASAIGHAIASSEPEGLDEVVSRIQPLDQPAKDLLLEFLEKEDTGLTSEVLEHPAQEEGDSSSTAHAAPRPYPVDVRTLLENHGKVPVEVNGEAVHAIRDAFGIHRAG
jgi:hypothetical protein